MLIMMMLPSIITAQMEGDQWVVGYWNNDTPDHSIMFFDFRNANLEINVQSQLKMQISGCSSNICTNNGEPLIWTNGMQIMGSDGKYIADTIAFDGDGLYWIGFTLPGYIPFGFPELDNAIILPVPGYLNEFLVIYHYNEEHPTEIYATSQYLEARIKVNINGSFELIYKDKSVGPKEKWFNGTISSVRHANGRDWWIIYFLANSASYYVHLLDPSGLHLDHIGQFDESLREGLGQSVFSSKGNYFARMDAVSKDSGEYITLFDFDRCSGAISRKATIHEAGGTFTGVAFSPSEQYFYANNNEEVWQWDLNSPVLEGSKLLVGTYDGFIQPGWFHVRFGPMITAPDGRIYILPYLGSFKFLHIIERPDLTAPECKFLQHSIESDIWIGRVSPNIPNYRLGPIDVSFCDSLGINNLPKSRWRYEPDQLNDPFIIRFTDLAFFDPDTWHWDFGDGGTSDIPAPLHTFDPGYYHVCQTVSNQYATDSTCQWIEILPTDIREELDRQLPDITIIPNPFKDFIQITSRSGDFRPAHIQLYDMHGRLVYQQNDILIPSRLYIPNFPGGIYLCTVKDEFGVETSVKLVKK